MIEKATVVNATYSGLEAYFPEGHELHTDSNLVLVVGPNGSGKTAFLRMLATSIDFRDYFEKNGISAWWHWYGLDKRTEYLEKDHRLDLPPNLSVQGWVPVSINDQILEFLSQDKRFGFDKKRDHCIRHVTRPATFYDQPVTAEIPVEFVTEGAYDKIKNVKKILGEGTDLNMWGYLKPLVTGGQVYTQIIAPVWGQQIKGRPDDSNRIEGELKYGDFIPFRSPLVMGTFGDGSKGRSIGLYTMSRIEKGFNSIERFFENQEIEPYRTKDSWGWVSEGEPIRVAEDSQLIALIDEPTAFLDYQKLYEFRNRVVRTLEKYKPRLQIFIATNDPVLIEKTPGCKYVNLYQQPAESTSTLLLPSQ